jgi:Protein of unknown function (DUF1236)
MKAAFIAGAVALGWFSAGQAWAQGVVALAPEQRIQMKQYIAEQKIPPARIPQGVIVGAILPDTVELQTAPAAWGPTITKYRYVYYQNHVVLVDPTSREIVQIID